MRRVRRVVAVPALAALLVLAVPQWGVASTGPKWSTTELTDFSAVVVTGRVEAVRSGWDPAVNSIYTYITIDVDEVLKGAVGRGHITIKQLGGEVGGIGLAVADQPSFVEGEQVLLFLEMRPRDRSLYTTALWQGKWIVQTMATGEAMALRRAHDASGAADHLSLGSARVASAMSALSPGVEVNLSPADAAGSQPFVLMSTAYRYGFNPAIDVQSGGQSGLAGGGFSEIQTAIARWNAAGSSFRYSFGSTGIAARCTTTQLGNQRVTISFMDPCGEISNSGGTLAIGGSYFFTQGGTTVNGQLFRTAIEGFVVNNDSSVALQFLRNSGCFHDIQLHEIGHVLGLGHTSDTNAIMFPSVNNNCANAQSGLGVDDVQGIQFIYPPPSGGGTPGTPTNVVAVQSGGVLNVSWTAPGGSPAPSGYRLDFRSGGTIVATVNTGAATSISVTIPPGTQGTFTVTVTAISGSTGGSPSAPATFTIGGGGGGGCTSPPPTPTGLTGGIAGGVASVRFNPSPGATSYIVQAGTGQGGSNLFNANIGAATAASAPVPPGFQAFVRAIAVNACGQSAPTADFVIGLTLGLGDLQVTLSWNTATDIDLHVIEPNGSHVYFASRTGTTARLDRDDVDGFGPENIFVNAGGAASGTYQVFIVHFSGGLATTSQIQVRVNAGTVNERFAVFTRSTSAGNPSLGFNVADVNVGAATITERGGTRATDQRENAVVVKDGRR